MIDHRPTAGRCALITGITGQDGSYLAELLLAKGYEVHGLLRRSARPAAGAGVLAATSDDDPVDDPGPAPVLHHADLTDSSRLVSLLSAIAPDELYHLGGQSHVGLSFAEPELTADVTALGTTRLLEALRMCELDTRFYHASSAEIFGATPPPQDVDTPAAPRSPHGVAKLAAHWTTRTYREAFGLFAVNGIAFNHESPRRGDAFVTRRIARAAARIAAGTQRHLTLGDLDAVRDWGYAPEYVEGMWRMLQADEPADHVLATGTAYSVEDFARLAFAHVGLDWSEFVRFDERRLRPVRTGALVGDASPTTRELGWRPTTFTPELAAIMVDAEVAALGGPSFGSAAVRTLRRPMAG